MEKEKYIKYSSEKMEANIDKYYHFIDNNNLYYFTELKSIISQNIDCLLLNNHIASICTTNHLLERFVKLSLINYYTLNKNYSDPQAYNEALIDSYKYDKESLHITLKKLKEIDLIDEQEFKYLLDLKDIYRNPYAHADTKKIIGSVPTLIKGRMYSLEDGMKAILTKNFTDFPYKETNILSESPPIAQMSIENHAKKNGYVYFKEVYEFILKINKRMQELSNNKEELKGN